jgi:hypothetical protein
VEAEIGHPFRNDLSMVDIIAAASNRDLEPSQPALW